ncbi:formylglycine-generating enzyme family protein [Flavimaricola marinus]|uniref:Formylglycine-generating sulfatase enzyme n=1 Tax=Flavimaricola marinus TaxID=1819565 RepID=A0A238LBR4_9RHOB|nr:SUMF1/EgtB/PvdO family nonheme iron enzyme [Flavimaricola marinus]SMY06360.1 Formylglycine-generating sulfatase enzyme [Flavimaricola marinus]
MFAALRSVLSKRCPLGVAMTGMVGAALVVGAALALRGPDLAYAPEMAPRAVELPDGRALFVQRYEVTIAEWNRCFEQSGCSMALRARPDQDPMTVPATGLNYLDVQEYLHWISKVTRHEWRLPTSEEWAFMAQSVLPETPDPIFSDPELTWASAYLVEGLASRALKPQGSFATTPEGIADLNGSVWEWTNECYSGDADTGRCPAYFVGGEHVAAIPFLVRDPARGGCAVGTPPSHLGMRLVTERSL